MTNQPPTITNPGAQSGTEGDVASLGIAASDADGDTLTYSATGLPAGLSIDSQSGLISGTLGGAGTYGVTITVSDGTDQASTSFSWAVSAANQPPTITNPGAQSGTEGDVVSLGIAASDADGDTLTYSATGLPAGLSIDGQSGLISGTLGAAGSYRVTASVSDGTEQASAVFDWVVSAPNGSGSLLEEDFTGRSLEGWTVVDEGSELAPSSWSAATGALVQSSNIWGGSFDAATLPKPGNYAVYDGGYGWTDYRATLSMRSDDNDEIGVMFRVQDANNYYRFSWNAQWGYQRLVRNVGGVFTLLGEEAISYVPGQTYQLDISVNADQIEVRIDGELVFSVTDASVSQGSIAAYSWAVEGASFDDISVTGVASPSDPLTGLVAAFGFDEAQGHTVKDVSGNGNNGVIVGANWTTTGRFDSALSFDGVDDAIDLDALDIGGGGLTISAWMKADDFGVADARLVSKATGVDNEDHYWMLSTFSNNSVRFRLKTNGSTTTLISNTEVVGPGQWHHVAATYDGLSMRLYVDGVEVGATAKSGAVDTNAGVPAGIGDQPQGGKPFAGLIDEVRLYSRGLTAAEIGADMATPVGAGVSTLRSEAGLVSGVSNAEWTLVNLEQTYDSMVVVATPRYGPSAPPQIVRVRNASGDSFELSIARVDGSTDAVSTTVDYLVVEEGVYDAATHGVTMEAVKYQSILTDSSSSWEGEWQTYANSYTNPVVIGQVMSANDPLPSSFWARGSSRTSPPDASTLYTGKTVCEDPEQLRADELIGFIVIEAGSGILGGRYFEAGVGPKSVFGMDNAPPYEYPLSNLVSAEVGLLSMATMGGANGGWPVLVQDLDPSGSAIGLAVDEDQLTDLERSHTSEQIAYIVLEEAVEDEN